MVSAANVAVSAGGMTEVFWHGLAVWKLGVSCRSLSAVCSISHAIMLTVPPACLQGRTHSDE